MKYVRRAELLGRLGLIVADELERLGQIHGGSVYLGGDDTGGIVQWDIPLDDGAITTVQLLVMPPASERFKEAANDDATTHDE